MCLALIPKRLEASADDKQLEIVTILYTDFLDMLKNLWDICIYFALERISVYKGKSKS